MQSWKQKLSHMQHYDMQAEIYDKQYTMEQNAKIETVLKSMTFGLNESVLDIGCGTGFLFPYLTKRVDFLVGVELSSKELQEAKKRAGKAQNVLLVQADADNLPFRDHSFDKAFMISVLQNMPEPKKTILEMRRVSKLEASFAVTGLRKKFVSENFCELLKNSRLKVVMFDDDEQLKGYVVVCVNG
jgi:demethylmenaquinone methyltransferase/2-methoxy-6-polyprenyl-1,4-benzoquinol methylase